MIESLNQHGLWTVGIYLVLAIVALWEALAPKRRAEPDSRWLHNGLLFGCLLVCTRLLLPAGLVGVAALAAEQGWGALSRTPVWLNVLAAILILDLLRYALHRSMHQVPALWRLHRTHHTDTEVDFTTALRFHPLELALDLGVKSAAILALGLPPVAVAIHELIAFVANTFTHANVRIHPPCERALRRILLTPDMHRVHHSREVREHSANYGAVFSFWDRVLGTYIAEPARGHREMQLGVSGFSDPRHRHLHWMLLNPLLRGDRTPALNPTALAPDQRDTA